MSYFQAIILSLVSMGVWEVLRRGLQYQRRRFTEQGAFKKLFDLDGSIVISPSIERVRGKIFYRDDDAWVMGEITPFLHGNRKGSVSHEYDAQGFAVDRPASHLVVIGSTRYNEYAALIQKSFEMPYEYLFCCIEDGPASNTLKIMAEHGDLLGSPRDHRINDGEIEVDYGILFIGNLSNGKKIVWISGIHGQGTIGVYCYLRENADLMTSLVGDEEAMGLSWLLRVQYNKNESNRYKMVVSTEVLDNPRRCARKPGIRRPPRALICDLGDVIMFFDRTRTYRAIAHVLGVWVVSLLRQLDEANGFVYPIRADATTRVNRRQNILKSEASARPSWNPRSLPIAPFQPSPARVQNLS